MPPLPLLRLGVRAAFRGFLVKSGLVISVLTWVGLCWLSSSLKGSSALVHVPLLAASWLCWGGGFLVMVGAALYARQHDGASDIFSRARAGGCTPRQYSLARMAGLCTLVGGVNAAAVLVIGALCIRHARHSLIAACVSAAIAAFVYVAMFSAVASSMMFAVVATQARWRGYGTLLLLFLVPDAIASALGDRAEWFRLAALPSALSSFSTAWTSRQTPGVLHAIAAMILAAMFYGALALRKYRPAA